MRILLFIVCTLALKADDWPMAFHDSQHTGASVSVVGPQLVKSWTWTDTNTYDTCVSNPGIAGCPNQPAPWLPIYYQGSLFLQGGINANVLFKIDPLAHTSTDGKFFCLNTTTGAVVWSYKTGAAAYATTYLQIPAISGNTIFVPSADHKIYSFNKLTGALLNTYVGNASFGPIILANNTLYTSDNNSVFYAFTGNTSVNHVLIAHWLPLLVEGQ